MQCLQALLRVQDGKNTLKFKQFVTPKLRFIAYRIKQEESVKWEKDRPFHTLFL
jgi:hypothetical protein